MSVVVPQARYQSGGKPVALAASRRSVKVIPEGGTSSYTPDTNGTIRLELAPSLQFLDCHNSYLSFRVKPKAGTVDLSKPCRMDEHAMSWCRSMTIYSSTGATLEMIDHMNLISCLMHKTTSGKEYRDSIGRMVDNTGSRAMRNAAMATPGGKVYNCGFDMSGILSGGSDNGRFLPLGFFQGPLTIELVLCPFAEAFVGTGLTTAGVTATPQYQLDNISYNAQCVSFSPEYNAKFAQQLRTRGIDMSFSTYKTHNTVLNSNSIDMSISQNSASVKGVYSVLRSKDKYQSPKHDSLSEYKSGNLKELQYDMGSKLFPEYPLKLENDGVVDLYSHNLHSFNMFRNHALGSSIGDANFATTEAKSHAAGGLITADAFKASTVRRIYGTWCANGKETYDNAKHLSASPAVNSLNAIAAAGLTGANVDTAISAAIQGSIGQSYAMTLDAATAGQLKNPLTGVTLANSNTVQFYHTVPTLTFVPDDPRDAHSIDPSMRCKIGVSPTDLPEGEATAAANIVVTHPRAADTGTADYLNLDKTNLGLDRFYAATPGVVPVAHANGFSGAAKNTNYEHDSGNIMYAGAPAPMSWAHTASGAAGAGTMVARQIAGLGIPFVSGNGQPILSKRVGSAFKGWVEVLPDDSGFYIGCNFETFPESQDLVSGSDLSSSVPLHLRLEYDAGVDSTTNFFAMKDNSDPFTSFVALDAVLRVQPDGTVVSSV